MANGKFITFEGGEGSGKSTQLKLFAQYLLNNGEQIVLTREPGATEVGKEIRRLLVEGDKDKFDEVTETLLFYADRRINLTKIVFPAIKEGKTVLSDRFNDSTIAYQYYGAAKFKNTEVMDTLYKVVAGDFKPDITFLLDIDVKEGLKRSFDKASAMANKELRFEKADISFHERLRNGYLEMAQKEPERFIVINAAQEVNKVRDDIIKAYLNHQHKEKK